MQETAATHIFGKSITDIRRELHKHPEVSGEEKETARRIAEYLNKIKHMSVTEGIGGHGLVAVKRYGPGKMIGFRAELDALAIEGQHNTEYSSQNPGVSHVCGHDGHMAMVLDLVQKLEHHAEDRGTLVLIFQPAEETGAGANLMVNEWRNHPSLPTPDFCFAFHNIPGKPLGLVCAKNGSFACGSAGMQLHLTGKTAHAAHPEAAINPLTISCDMLRYAMALPQRDDIPGFALCTPISMHSGNETFGTSPPDALLRMTLRAAENNSLDKMMGLLEDHANRTAKAAGAKVELAFTEHFPATVNAPLWKEVKEVCNSLSMQCQNLPESFRWSEDFAHFTRLCPSFMMGLGSGESQPALHNPDFDFPDALIDKGSSLYAALYKAFNS